jgi:hypothetical protein
MTELLSDPGHIRRDMQMIKQAIVHKWDIPEELFAVLPKVAGAMAIKGKGRDQVTAMAILLKMKEQNDRLIPVQQPGRSSVVNVGVSIANVPDAGKRLASEILERLRADGVPGIVSGDDTQCDSE